eukprot:scaffold955_cov79-Skeletonema_dohrnii-CCMP3373.AAC.5
MRAWVALAERAEAAAAAADSILQLRHQREQHILSNTCHLGSFSSQCKVSAFVATSLAVQERESEMQNRCLSGGAGVFTLCFPLPYHHSSLSNPSVAVPSSTSIQP